MTSHSTYLKDARPRELNLKDLVADPKGPFKSHWVAVLGKRLSANDRLRTPFLEIYIGVLCATNIIPLYLRFGITMDQASQMATLREAFPNLSPSTIQDIYNARGGNVQAAFDTLLMISGPQTSPSPALAPPPPTPPRPQSASYAMPLPSPSPSPHMGYNASPSYPNSSPGYLRPPPPAPMAQQNNTLSPQQSPGPPQYVQTGHAQSYFADAYQQNTCLPSHSPQPSPRPSPQPSPGLYPQQQPSPQPSPGLYPQQLSPYPAGHSVASNGNPSMPDLSTLSLGNSPQSVINAPKIRNKHAANCDGCGADPIRGLRWRCLKCANEDLCNSCKEAGVQSSHRFEQIAVDTEQHEHTCDGCTTKDRFITGPRYQCQTHADEDFCGTCVREGRACKGPFKEVKASPLGHHLEKWCCVPMPKDWVPLLQPPTEEFHMGDGDASNSWNQWPTRIGLCRTPRRDWTDGTAPTSEYEVSGVSEHRGKFTWTLSHLPTRKTLWSFKAKLNHHQSLEEGSITPAHGKAISFSRQRTANGDSLSFTSHNGTRLRWATNAPCSNLNGNRFDLTHHALFASDARHKGRETIIANQADWDGDLEEPGDCLTLRTREVDTSLIVASLFAVISYELYELARERREQPTEVSEVESAARLLPLGRLSFWYMSDFVDPNAAATGHAGMSSGEKIHMVNSGMKVLGGGLKLAAAVLNASGGM